MGKNSLKIKKGDTVKVIAGKDKGAEGKVIAVLREQQRVVVEVSVIRFPYRSCGRRARSAPPCRSSRRDGAW